MDCTVELDFADGKYIFALPVPQINELQAKCGIGIAGLFRRVYQGVEVIRTDTEEKIVYLPQFADFHLADIRETIRQGLIGGGKGMVDGQPVEVTPQLANRLIENYVDGKPLMPAWNVAASVLGACITGFEPPKKKEAAAPRARKTRKAG